MDRIDRRQVLLGAAAAVAAGHSPARAAVSSGKSSRFDFDDPLDNVTAYLKLRASVETRDVYFWFSGGLDMAVPGQPIVPIIATESLILRRTVRVAEDQWNVTDWEATFYRDLESGELAAEVTNPASGERVRPVQYREGPVPFRFSRQEPRLIGIRDVLPKTGNPFRYPWRIVGDGLWMTKGTYIDTPHWLKPSEFPKASPGERLYVSSISTLKASLSEVEKDSVTAARSEFSYQATSGWLPWMQMGQQPGFVIWHSAGQKLFDLDEVPSDTLAILQEVHPIWFERPEPWPEFINMFLIYAGREGAA